MSAEHERSKPGLLANRPMVLALLASGFTMIGFYLLLSVVPLYADQAGGGSTGAGLTTAAFMLSTVLAQVWMPRILARFGYRTVLAAGRCYLGFPRSSTSRSERSLPSSP